MGAPWLARALFLSFKNDYDFFNQLCWQSGLRTSGSATPPLATVGRGRLDSPHLWTRRPAEHAPGLVCACSAGTRSPAPLHPCSGWSRRGRLLCVPGAFGGTRVCSGEIGVQQEVPRSWGLVKSNCPEMVRISFAYTLLRLPDYSKDLPCLGHTPYFLDQMESKWRS